MPKHVEKVGLFEDYLAPWETAAGETEIDKARLKKHLFNLTVDKAKAYDARDEASAKVDEAARERDEAKAKLEKGGDPDLAKELEAERTKTAEAVARAEKAERQALVSEVAQEKGLTPAQAKRLVGATKDELEADADDLLKSFGGAGEADDGDEDETSLRRTPLRGSNPGDPATRSKVTKEPDYDAIAAGIVSRNLF